MGRSKHLATSSLIEDLVPAPQTAVLKLSFLFSFWLAAPSVGDHTAAEAATESAVGLLVIFLLILANTQ